MTDADTTSHGAPAETGLYRDALEALILTATIAKDARQATERRLKGFGAIITAPQYRLLRQLQQGRATIKELSHSMRVEPATLVTMVDTLERHGLLRRGADPHDRRRTPLELTEAGLAQLGQVPFVHEDDPIARYLRALTDEERQTFLRHLRGLVTSLHGEDSAARQIADAVTTYFDFGQAMEASGEQQRRSKQSARQARRSPAARAKQAPPEEEKPPR
jgi:DNA-binding MarR family transcriptional regulator